MSLKTKWQQWRARKAQPLPYTMTPYRAELERLQRRWVILLIGLLGLLGWYAYQYTQARAEAEKLQPVLVAQVNLVAPVKLSQSDLRVISVPQKFLPQGTWAQPTDLVGQTLRRDVVANEIILPADVQPKLDPKSISAKFEEAFAFTVGEDWLVAKLPGLRPGDQVDILASNPEVGTDATTLIAQQLTVLAVQSAGGRKNLVLNVTAPEAQALLYARSLRLPMQILVHSAISPLIDIEPLNPATDV